MKKVTVEFPVIGYAEVVIEVEDDMDADEILEAIEDGSIEVPYNEHDHAEALTPLMNILDYKNAEGYIPFKMQVVE